MSDINDALKRLARRGEPRGFDAVLAGANESAADESAQRDARGDDLDTIPFVTTEPVVRRRRPLGSMIAAAGVAALVLVGAFAVSAVVGSGGAGSAEAAVRRLADAVSHEDLLSAADVLAPEEVRSLHGTIDNAAKKAQELALVQTASAPLAGIDFNIDNLNLSTEALGDGYARVTIDAGTFTASTHKKQFSALMQKVLLDTDDNSSQSDLAKLASDEDLPTFVVTVRRDGRWYVSAAYTVLEYVREVNKLPPADFGSGVRTISTLGADSPDAAVQDALRDLAGSDWSKLMTMVSPDEIPVYDYRDALTTLAQRNNDDSGGSSPAFTIDSMSTNAQVDGDTAKVSLKASGTSDSGKWSLDGGCFTSSQETISFTCSDETGLRGGIMFGGVDQSSQFTVVKQDGRWFVSPVGTVLDALDHFITQLDRRTLFTLLNIPNELPPDGRLTLGQPVALNKANQHLQVLTYEGHKGESLLGQATDTSASANKSNGGFNGVNAGVRVFGPDGAELRDSSVIWGEPLTLPSDGTYIVVEQTYAFLRGGGDASVTIWHTADAPASARQSSGGSCVPATGESIAGEALVGPGSSCLADGSLGLSGTGGQSCTYSSDGSQKCTAETVPALPTIGPNGEMLDQNGTPITLPDGTPMTVPASLRDAIKQAGQNGGGSFSSGSSSGTAPAIAPAVAPTYGAVTTTTHG